MKKTIILCLSILLIALTGCKKDQNSWGKLDEGAITVNVGETKQLTFEHDGNQHPQWTSENENIATVDENGVVTGVRVGTTIVSVNGLSCTVTVIDNYMNVIEPCQDWSGDYKGVNDFMIQKYGNITIPELENDTIYIPNADSTEWDTIPYVMHAKYVYEASLEGQFVDEYEYTFEFDTLAQASYLTMATMKINANHTGDITKYLNNRYVEVSNKYYTGKNQWGLTSHIYDKSPLIVFSGSKITDK